MKILVINAGSSSLKFQLIDMDDESVKAKGLVERIGIEGTHFKQTVLGTDQGDRVHPQHEGPHRGDFRRSVRADGQGQRRDRFSGRDRRLRPPRAAWRRDVQELRAGDGRDAEGHRGSRAARPAASAGEHRGHQGLPGGYADQAERCGVRHGFPSDHAEEGVPLWRAV